MSDQWIPTSGENGRNPMGNDANVDGRVLYQRPDFTIAVTSWSNVCEQTAVAWMPLPDPYVPPPEPEKPKRESLWFELSPRGDLFDGAIYRSEESANRHKHFRQNAVVEYRRVLDDDCCSDGARQVLEEMESDVSISTVGIGRLRRWIELLKGGDACQTT